MLNKYQVKTIHDFMPPACTLLMKRDNLRCSITATRVVFDVLAKSNFKVRPLAVQARVYNPLYTQKMRPPESDEEANQWLEEGCWSIVYGGSEKKVANKWPGHLVAVVNDACIIDLSIVQAYRPDKNLIVNPVFAEINDEFLSGEIQRGVNNNGCLIVYKAIPEDDTYTKNKSWIDKKAIEILEKDVVQLMRESNKKPVFKKDSPLLKNEKIFNLRDGAFDEIAVPIPQQTEKEKEAESVVCKHCVGHKDLFCNCPICSADRPVQCGASSE